MIRENKNAVKSAPKIIVPKSEYEFLQNKKFTERCACLMKHNVHIEDNKYYDNITDGEKLN